MIDLKPIKNIIFDLGNVLINIAYQNTIDAFKQLNFNDFDESYKFLNKKQVFEKLETGKISPQSFRNELKQFIHNDISDDDVDAAWNSMLVDFPDFIAEILKNLNTKYRVFLLSNTNKIHIEWVKKKFKDKFNVDFNDLFEKIYCSHEIHMKKPDIKTYEHVLKDSNLIAKETLFIDDLSENIEAAQKIGINSYLLKDGNISKIFMDYK